MCTVCYTSVKYNKSDLSVGWKGRIGDFLRIHRQNKENVLLHSKKDEQKTNLSSEVLPWLLEPSTLKKLCV